jgi:hypothetical protein
MVGGKEKGKGKTHHHNKKENQQKPRNFLLYNGDIRGIVYF